MRPVEVLDRLAAPAVPVWPAVHGDALEQQVGGDPVGFHQFGRADAGDGAHGLGNPLVVQPRPAIAGVEFRQLGAEHAFLHHLGEAGASRHRRVVDVALYVSPAHADQLRYKRFFDGFQFPTHSDISKFTATNPFPSTASMPCGCDPA